MDAEKSALPFTFTLGLIGKIIEMTKSKVHAPSGKYYLAVAMLGLYMVVHFLILAFLIISLWPESNPQSGIFSFPVFSVFSLSDEANMALFVMVMGAFGGALVSVDIIQDVAVGTFSSRLEGREEDPFNVFKPFIEFWAYNFHSLVGAGIALLIYLLIRAGMLIILVGGDAGGSESTLKLDPYGVAAIAGLSGAFSYEAARKLREVAGTVFAIRNIEKIANTPQDNHARKANPSTNTSASNDQG